MPQRSASSTWTSGRNSHPSHYFPDTTRFPSAASPGIDPGRGFPPPKMMLSPYGQIETPGDIIILFLTFDFQAPMLPRKSLRPKRLHDGGPAEGVFPRQAGPLPAVSLFPVNIKKIERCCKLTLSSRDNMGKPIEEKIHPEDRGKTSIQISYFNMSIGTTSSTFSHWGEGVCFQSPRPFEVGSTVWIRSRRAKEGVAGNAPPPMNALGRVTSCREMPGTVPPRYEVRVRYFLPEY